MKSKRSNPKKTKKPLVKRSIKTVKKPKKPLVKQTKAAPSTNIDKRLATVSESTKIVSKEVKAISKIFMDSHKILISMKTMISTLSSTMQYIDKHSKQISLLEEESQMIRTKLQHVNQDANSVKSSNTLVNDMAKRISAVENKVNFDQIKKDMSESLGIIKNIAQTLSKLSNSVNDISPINIESKLDSNTKMLQDVAKRLHDHVQIKDKDTEHDEISEKISVISREIAGLREQTRSISDAQKTDELTEHMSAVSSKTEVLMGVPAELLEIQSRLDSLEGKLYDKKEINVKEKGQISTMLLEYQVKIRMNSESKYGDLDDLKSMIKETSKILSLVDDDTLDGVNVTKWGVSRILECADKWELRFSDALSMMIDMLGTDVLKKAIRIKQVKDVYGVRAVEDTKTALEIT
ncbi:MAG: hypothetical protein K8823_1414 [Cenarchaeum symbiont of Oopsacas minuta]|nr:hypothetical protein [Cenarchaeum symbiont of Oopsacas minuta]